MAAIFSPAANAPPFADRLSPPADSHRPVLLLRQCRTLEELRQAHGLLIKAGLFPSQRSAVEDLLDAAALSVPGGLRYAVDAFHRLPAPDAAACNVMIRGLTAGGSPRAALAVFLQMLADPAAPPDQFTFSCILKTCSRLRSLHSGEQIHAMAVKFALSSREFVHNSLIHMYAACGRADAARRLFDGISLPDLVAWNSMFAGYAKLREWGAVVDLFRRMVDSRAPFDGATLIVVLNACGRLGELELGEWISRYVKRKKMRSGNTNLATSLMDMFAKCGHLGKARALFDQMPSRDVVAWSAMISGYAQRGCCREALDLFRDMQLAGVQPNEVTMVGVLSACAAAGALETGRWVHSFVRRSRLKLTVSLGTALVDFYAKCGCVDSAMAIFSEMPKKNVLSWTALIQGLASNGRAEEALDLFSSMLAAGVRPNEVTLLAALCACGHAGLVADGLSIFDSMKSIHDIEPRIDHCGCVIDLLARAGQIEEARRFIETMPVEPNAIVWRILLASCKIHGEVEIGEESLNQISRFEPLHSGDYLTMSSIYASAGRTEDASRIRARMKEIGIRKPSPGCSSIEVDSTVHEFFAIDHPCRRPRRKEIHRTAGE